MHGYNEVSSYTLSYTLYKQWQSLLPILCWCIKCKSYFCVFFCILYVWGFALSQFIMCLSSAVYWYITAYRCLHGSAPPYLAETIFDVWCLITSPSQIRIDIDTTHSVTQWTSLGDRAFPVATLAGLNALRSSVRTLSTYLTFCRELKTLLFKASFEDQTWSVWSR